MPELQPPEFPTGPWSETIDLNDDQRRACIERIAACPTLLRVAVENLNDTQLDTRYRNWSLRQIVHHIADSHVNSYIRFKWALTEETPTIKAYDEGRWSKLSESQSGDIEPSLRLLEGLHLRWCQLLSSLSAGDFERAFIHPETQSQVSLNQAVSYYAWHGEHHREQILWVRKHRLKL